MILFLLFFSLSFYVQATNTRVIDSEINNVNGVSGLGGVNDIAISADGRHIYATGFTDNAVTHFARDSSTGLLSFTSAVTQSDIGFGLQGAFAVGVSPDDKHVYVASASENALVVFSRDPIDGTLSLVEILQDDINGVDGLWEPSAIAFSADNQRVYVTSKGDNALAVFARNSSSGSLSFLTVQKNGENDINTLGGASAINVLPNNIFIYVAASSDNAISVFTRNPSLGEIAFVKSYQNSVDGITGLNGVNDLMISPDNRHLYAISSIDNALVAFELDAATGLLSFNKVYRNGENGIDGLNGATAITISSDGERVYVAGTQTIAIFERFAESGQLSFRQAFSNNTQDISTLGNLSAIIASPEAGVIYTAASSSNAITALNTFSADIEVAMIANNTVAINSLLSYQLVVANYGPDIATGVTLTDTLPPFVSFKSADANQGTCQYNESINHVICLFDSLANNTTGIVNLSLTAPSSIGSGTLTNTATVEAVQTDTNTVNNTVSKATTLVESIPTADLMLDISTNLDLNVVSINTDLIYTVKVTNKGPDTATDVVLTSILPDNVIYNTVGSDSRCTPNGITVTCQLALDINETVEVPIPITTTTTTGVIRLITQVFGAEFDPNLEDNIVEKVNLVEALAFDLAITDAVATPSTVFDLATIDALGTPRTFDIGTLIYYTINFKNQGVTTATAVKLTGFIPSEKVSYISSQPEICSFNESQQIVCEMGNLLPRLKKGVVITGKTKQTGQNILHDFTVSGNGVDTNENDNSKRILINIGGDAADLVVTAEGAESVLIGESITYTVSVENQGPKEASARLEIALSGNNVSIEEITGDGCTGTTCALGNIPVGESKTVLIKAKPTVLEQLVLTATVKTVIEGIFDPIENNTAIVKTVVTNKQADLGVSLTAIPTTTFLGKSITYSTTVTNNGPHQATGVIFTQELPASVTLVPVPKSSQGDECVVVETDNLINCALGPINSGATATITVVVTPQSLGKINSVASVSSNSFDPVQENNTVSLKTEVKAQTADLGVTISAAPNPVLVDNPLTLTVTVTNQGPDPTINIKIINQLPENVLLQSSGSFTPTESAGSCAEMGADRLFECTINSLPNEGTVTLSFVVQPTVAGQFSISTQLSSNAIDPNEDNNSAAITSQANNPSTLYFVEAQKNGVADVQGLTKVFALTMSPDGEFIYAVGFSDNAVAVFKRLADDKLQFLQALLDENIGLNKPTAITLSPDGAYAYVTSFGDNAISVFRRDGDSGLLSFVATYKEGESEIDGLEGAFSVAITENHVYIAGVRDNAISIFDRDTQSGELSFIEVVRFEEESHSLNGINALALTQTGEHLFATSSNANRLSVFSREAESGKLSLIQTFTNNENAQGLDQPNGVVVSSDEKSVYTVAGGSDSAIALFSRAPDSGLLTFKTAYRNGTNDVEGLIGAADIAISPSGSLIYVAGTNENALVIFRRNAETGELSFIEAKKDGEEGVDGLGGVRAVAVSPSGIHIYAAGFTDNAIAVFSVASADLSVVINENSTSVKLGETLVDTITVTNNGPHPATGVLLEVVLPLNVDLLPPEPSQGGCSNISERINCALGTLNVGASATIIVKLSPTEIGEIILSATVSTKLVDPSANNSAKKTRQVVMESDLGLEIRASTTIATVQSPLSYEITIINHSSQAVGNITLRDVIPEEATFESAELNGESSFCPFDRASRTVTCTITSLAAGARQVLTVVIIPTTEGTLLTNTATISANIVDPNTANNQVTLEIAVPVNIVEVTENNADKTLQNPHVSPTGAIIGGAISGQINNEGLISNVRVLPDSIVTGGKLSKTILNEGIIENVQLLSDTIINGGILRGEIKGFPAAPAAINAEIAPATRLSYVMISTYSKVSPEAILGKGGTFITNELIPEGIDLTGTLPTITGSIGSSAVVDLSQTVLVVGISLLESINAIPELKDNDLVFSQSDSTGHLTLPIGKELMVLRPITIRQGLEEENLSREALKPSMKVYPEGYVTFITPNRRQIVAQPTVQNQAAIQEALQEAGITQIEFTTDGNLRLEVGGKTHTVRPDLYTYSIDPNLPLGFTAKPSRIVTGVNEIVFRFKDDNGISREQKFYPVPAHQAELRSQFQGYPGASAVTFFNNGKVSIKIGKRTYSAVFDYLVTSGESNHQVTQLLFVPDINGDESEDVKIFYANGDEQLLYVMPFPEIAAEIQDIETVQSADYAVSQDIYGNYLLEKDDTQWLMSVSEQVPADDDTSPGMEIQADGSVIFITPSKLKVTMQPTMQDLPALEGALGDYGIASAVVQENGNIAIPINDTLSASTRPNLTSVPAWFGLQLGLHNVPTILPGVLNVVLVYLDDTAQKRMQILYPAAKYPQKANLFFRDMPDVSSVIFNNDGTLSVEGTSLNFRGIFGYAVELGGVGTGHFQFIDIPDANGDSVDDFTVIYETGERQVIYQIPEVHF
jgi:uncharacterized repeat protein (TIGR01451 family)